MYIVGRAAGGGGGKASPCSTGGEGSRRAHYNLERKKIPDSTESTVKI